MRPVLFICFGYPVHSYKVMLYVGLLFGIAVGQTMARASGLPAERVYVATLLLLIPALAGARLLFVATHWPIYASARDRIWRLTEGGMSMYGGLPLALGLSVPLLGVLDVPFAAFWDVSAFTILTGMIFTRVGCLLNGCCAGRPTHSRFGLRLPNSHGISCTRVPMPLMEAAWGALTLAVAAWLWSRQPYDGAVFLFVVANYSAGRLVLQRFREPEHVVVVSVARQRERSMSVT